MRSYGQSYTMVLTLIRSALAIALAVAVVGDRSSALGPEAPLPEAVLARLFPELRKPRLMTLEDLTTEDGRIAFKDYKYSFRLTGDFNGDGLPDQAIAGRFENPQNGRDVSFAAILTMRKNQWQREWFYRPDSETTVLQLAPHPDKAKARKGYHAILVQFSEMPSHNYVVIYWNGKKYDAFSGFDTRHWEGYDR